MKSIFTTLTALILALTCTACGHVAASPSEKPSASDRVEQAAPAPSGEANTPSLRPLEEPAPTPEAPPQEEILPQEPIPADSADDAARTVDPSMPMVALTFDDGPDPKLSPLLLDILEENHAAATFFEVGRNVKRHPEIVARADSLGCEIGSHSNGHEDLGKLSQAAILENLATADEAFTAAIGRAPYLLRPPYGSVNHAVKEGTGRCVITWRLDTVDWNTKDPQAVIDAVLGAGDLDGQIILMHSNHASTIEAMKTVVPQLLEDGYQLVTVSELMAYYYGEAPRVDQFYGYTYFHQHSRTDTPASMSDPYPTPQIPTLQPMPAPEQPAPSPVVPPVQDKPSETPPPEETPPAPDTADSKIPQGIPPQEGSSSQKGEEEADPSEPVSPGASPSPSPESALPPAEEEPEPVLPEVEMTPPSP